MENASRCKIGIAHKDIQSFRIRLNLDRPFLERILFYFFVITNNYASIAFILTAKGLTRFKELDDKNFAEYVLIGTLLSSGLAIFCAVLITEMIKMI